MSADGRLAVFVGVSGLEMVAIDGGLFGAHGDTDDLAQLGDDLLAEIGLAAAQDDGGEHFPEAMDVADLRGEFFVTLGFGMGFLFLAEVAFGDQEFGSKLIASGGGIRIREPGMGFGAGAGGPPGEAEDIREPVFDGSGGEDELEPGIDLADAGADDGILTLHLDAFVHRAGPEGILAEIGERGGIDAFYLEG